MDYSQLERYVRLAFEGRIDEDFLPRHSLFWHAFSVYGGGDRGPPKPGDFFAGLYTTIPSMIDGIFTRHDGTKIDADIEYRTRLEKILEKILEECINYDGSPNKEQSMLAQGSIDAVSSIKFSDGAKYLENSEKRIYTLAHKLKEDKRYASLDYHFI